MFQRIIELLGEENLNKIQSKKILLIGIGGVGGYTLESLIRSGFEDITVIDHDIFEDSNLNRQIYALQSTLGKKKTYVAKERACEINPNCQINVIDKFLTDEDITGEKLLKYNYIIDACDTVSVKEKLIAECSSFNIPLISCMGTANRTHPELLEITNLSKTSGDPLAKKLRSLLHDNKKALKTTVVCSREIPIKSKKLGTICSVPMTAGSLLTSYLINDITKK